MMNFGVSQFFPFFKLEGNIHENETFLHFFKHHVHSQLINSRRKTEPNRSFLLPLLIQNSIVQRYFVHLLSQRRWFSSNNSNGLFPTFHGWYAKKAAVPHINFLFLDFHIKVVNTGCVLAILLKFTLFKNNQKSLISAFLTVLLFGNFNPLCYILARKFKFKCCKMRLFQVFLNTMKL